MTWFYFWTAMTSGWSSRPERDSPFYYALLAKSFLAGHLHLLIDPRPELLALPDPYDARQNAPYRLHDAILFNRKYYLYYGPAPAVLLFMPFRYITGLDLPEPLVVAFFCSAALVSAFILVRFLARTYMPETPFWLLAASIPALGFGSGYPFLLRRPIHYEVPIAVAQSFVIASLCCFVAGTLGGRIKNGYVAAGSLLLGFAAGARFTMLAAGLIPAVLLLWVLVTHRDQSWRGRLTAVAALLVPVASCVFLLGLYNYLRFGSWTQFGLTYTLHAWISARVYQFMSLSRVPAGVFYYLLVPPRFIATFPFIALSPTWYLTPPRADYYLEPVGGLLPDAPFAVILLFAPAAIVAFRRTHLALCLFIGASTLVGLALLGLYSTWAGTMRYEIDFAMFLLIPAMLLWYLTLNALGNTDWRRTAAAAALVSCIGMTVITNAAYSIVGYYDNLRTGSPETYEAIHAVFKPLERLFASMR